MLVVSKCLGSANKLTVQSEELKFDSIIDIQSLAFFKHIDILKKSMDCLATYDSVLCSL